MVPAYKGGRFCFLHVATLCKKNSIALFIGWVGFSSKIRKRHLGFHKICGRIYVICFLITAITSILVSYHAMGGWVSQAGFMAVGIIAAVATYQGFVAIKNKNIALHMVWMRYSYACCLASVSLRILTPTFYMFLADEILIYRLAAWLAWLPNLAIAYIISSKKEPNLLVFFLKNKFLRLQANIKSSN